MSLMEETCAEIEEARIDPDGEYQGRLDRLTKPAGSLGRLEDLAVLYCSILREPSPSVRHKVVFVMAGDHGVVEEGVSAFPQEVTVQMVANFLAGGAAINVLARHVGARVVVVDCGVAGSIEPAPGLKIKKVGRGTRNIAQGPAMSREEAVRSIEAGIESFEEEWTNGIHVIGAGDMGIGNTTPSAAIAAVLAGRHAADVVGRGTGIDDDALRAKVAVVERSLAVNQPNPRDGLDVLAKVGGFEIGALAGLCLAAARRRRPVVLDGFISTAGALIAVAVEPKVKGYLIASHSSVEIGHRVMLDSLALKPLFDLGLRLGEGTGAALGIGLVEAAVRLMQEMATFSGAGVTSVGQHKGG